MLVLFRNGLPPNRTCPFPGIRLSSDLLRERWCGVPVDQVVAVAADHEGLAADLGHGPGPLGLRLAGLVNLTKSTARALAPRVRVNCITPGVTMTTMGQDTIDALDKNYAKNKMLLQRYATPAEIAQVIVFLASPLNSFMTGATVDVNGGRDLR